MVIISDITKPKILSSRQSRKLVHGRIQAEIFLALKLSIGLRYKRKNPHLRRFEAVEIAELPRHPSGVGRM